MIFKLKGAALAVLAAFCALPAFAQYTAVSGSHAGPSGAAVANATIYWQLASAARIGTSSGQLLSVPVTATVTAGAFTMPANSIADTSLSNPANPCYAVTIIDNISGATLLGAGLAPDGIRVNPGGPYGCVQPSGSSWSLDSFIPASAPTAAVVAGPMGPVGVANWRGTWTPTTAYARNDGFVEAGNGYIVITAYTSGGSFGSTDTTNSVQVAIGCPTSGCAMSGTITAPNLLMPVTAFGAIGDGTTNNYTALTAALTYARTNGACLYFPKGAYMTGSQLTWNTSVPLCLIGEQSSTSYIDYNGGSVSGGGFEVHNTTTPGNGYYSNVNLRNIGFAANTNAQSALHLWKTVGALDSLDFAGGSSDSLRCDDCNLQGDARNLRTSPGMYFPAITGATCVNGLTFSNDGTTGSGQFSMESPTVQGCTGIGLNLADATSIVITGAQIAGNHQQLYQNCVTSCNNNGVTFDQSLFEQLGATVSITAWSITSNVTCFTSTNTLTAGKMVTVWGFPTSTFFNGLTYTVNSSGLSGSQFCANFTHANASGTEAGDASTYAPNQVYGGGNTFVGTNLGFFPILIYGNNNTFAGQNFLDAYIQTGAANNTFINNGISNDSQDAGTATQGFGNYSSSGGGLTGIFNNMTTIQGFTALGGNVIFTKYGGNPLIEGTTGAIRISGDSFAHALLLDNTSANAGTLPFDTAIGYKFAGTLGFTGTKTAGSCVLTIQGGIITNVTGC